MTIHNHDPDGTDYIERRHKRYQLLGNHRDGLDSADDYDRREYRNQYSGHPFRKSEVLLQGCGNGVRLRHTADSERRDSTEQCEQDAQPFGVQTSLQRSERAADHASVFRLLSVLDRHRGFHVFGRDAQNAGHPHPEDCSRSAARHRSGNADDVSGSDCRRKSGRQRTELRYFAFSIRIRRNG